MSSRAVGHMTKETRALKVIQIYKKSKQNFIFNTVEHGPVFPGNTEAKIQ